MNKMYVLNLTFYLLLVVLIIHCKVDEVKIPTPQKIDPKNLVGLWYGRWYITRNYFPNTNYTISRLDTNLSLHAFRRRMALNPQNNQQIIIKDTLAFVFSDYLIATCDTCNVMNETLQCPPRQIIASYLDAGNPNTRIIMNLGNKVGYLNNNNLIDSAQIISGFDIEDMVSYEFNGKIIFKLQKQ